MTLTIRRARDIAPSARKASYRLSYEQRAILIRHIDGASPIVARNRALFGLIHRGLLTNLHGGIPQKNTKITDLGREVLAALLAEYAEGLIAAGFSPLDYTRHVHATTQPQQLEQLTET